MEQSYQCNSNACWDASCSVFKLSTKFSSNVAIRKKKSPSGHRLSEITLMRPQCQANGIEGEGSAWRRRLFSTHSNVPALAVSNVQSE